MTDSLETGKIMNRPQLTNCLDFSSMLVSSGKEFNSFVKIGNNFVFNLSFKESGTSFSFRMKKFSPSIQRKNAVRLLEFLEKKNTSAKDTLEDANKMQNTTSKNPAYGRH